MRVRGRCLRPRRMSRRRGRSVSLHQSGNGEMEQGFGQTLPINSSGWRYHLECMICPVKVLFIGTQSAAMTPRIETYAPESRDFRYTSLFVMPIRDTHEIKLLLCLLTARGTLHDPRRSRGLLVDTRDGRLEAYGRDQVVRDRVGAEVVFDVVCAWEERRRIGEGVGSVSHELLEIWVSSTRRAGRMRSAYLWQVCSETWVNGTR